MNIKRQLANLVGFCIIAALGWSAASAQAAALTITNPAFIRCENNIIEGSFGVTASDGSSVVNSSTPLSAAVYATSSAGVSAVKNWNYVAGQSVSFAFIFPGGYFYADLFVAAGARSDTYRFGCDGTITNLGGGGSGGSDGRLNRYHGDLMNVLYSSGVGGQPAIAVYSLDANSRGIWQGYFTLEDIAPFVGAPPAVNTAIRTIDQSTLYAITSGEFQINVGPDDEDKLYTVIFDGLPVTSVYFR